MPCEQPRDEERNESNVTKNLHIQILEHLCKLNLTLVFDYLVNTLSYGKPNIRKVHDTKYNVADSSLIVTVAHQ